MSEFKSCPVDNFGDDGHLVFSVKRVQGGVRVREECDRYFEVVVPIDRWGEVIREMQRVGRLPDPL